MHKFIYDNEESGNPDSFNVSFHINDIDQQKEVSGYFHRHIYLNVLEWNIYLITNKASCLQV